MFNSKSIKSNLIKVYEFIIFSPISLLCNWIEVFARGEPQWRGESIQDKSMRRAFIQKAAKSNSTDPDGRYNLCLPHIQQGSKVIDLGSAHGRLHDILLSNFGDIDYLGLEYDCELVDIAQKNGRNVEQFDLNDLDQFELRMSQYKPDTVIFMYVSCSIREPHKVLEICMRHSKQVLFGCANYGHWTQRLRFFFGRGPVTGINLYEAYLQFRNQDDGFNGIFSRIKFAKNHWVPDTKRYARLWTMKDHLSLFKDLRAKYTIIGYRGYRRGDHYRKMFMGSLRAKGFQFLISSNDK